MTSRARAFRETHSPAEALTPALPAYYAHAEGRGPAAGLEELARTVHLPVATVRGAMSSYADSRSVPGAVRVCAGTSCMLAGAGDVVRDLAGRHACEPVYCLGYCDRSPAALSPGGRVMIHAGPHRGADLIAERGLVHPPPPSIRCAARRPIVTARLMDRVPGSVPVPPYDGLRTAIEQRPEDVIAAIDASGLRGRGGAAFPTGRKWRLAAAAGGEPRYIVANGDEGDPGSFIDRELMERDPHAILEGMAIAAHAVGAARGIVFIRSEYPLAAAVMAGAIADAESRGLLGEGVLGAGRSFHVEVVRGMGSYVCGEETALLAAIEGQRGEVRPRPPYPVERGVFGKPTVVDNVETLVNVPWIITHGAAAFASMGTVDSKGTKAVCLNHGFARPGIVEVEFGVTLRAVIEEHGGGAAAGTELEAVLLGGPMGSLVLPEHWDTPMCFVGMGRASINLGHAGLVAIPRPADWHAILRHLLTFMRDESCGKCVPCRLGSAHACGLVQRPLTTGSAAEIRQILALMKDASLCAFGRETPGPVMTILNRFSDRVVGDRAS